MSRHQRSVEGTGAAVDGARTRDATRPTLEAGIVRQFIGEQPRRRDRCVYCGYPSPNRDGVCVGHADLGGSVE